MGTVEKCCGVCVCVFHSAARKRHSRMAARKSFFLAIHQSRYLALVRLVVCEKKPKKIYGKSQGFFQHSKNSFAYKEKRVFVSKFCFAGSSLPTFETTNVSKILLLLHALLCDWVL